MKPTRPNIRQCPHCSKSFKTVHRLKVHLITHDENASVSCKICGKTLKNRAVLYAHMQYTHSNKVKPTCKICSTEFITPRNLRRHKASVHSMEARPRYTCSMVECRKTFLSNDALSKHFRTEHAENPVRFCCTLCGRECKTNQNLEAHIATHTGEKSYKCETCGMSFVTHGGLKTHEKVHKEISTRKVYKCEFCPRTLLSKLSISRHVRATHGDGDNYSCTLCNKGPKSFSGLRYHILTKHRTDNVPNYSCEECEYKTLFKTSLTVHVRRVHEGVKRNECYFCGKEFFAFAGLVRHCSSVHTLEK